MAQSPPPRCHPLRVAGTREDPWLVRAVAPECGGGGPWTPAERSGAERANAGRRLPESSLE